MFDHYTVSEWIEQKLYPMYSKLSLIRSEADELRRVKFWPARPYQPLEALLGLGIGIRDTPESAMVETVTQANYSEMTEEVNAVGNRVA